MFRPAVYFDQDPDTGGNGGAEDKDKQPQKRAFTQAELDAMFADRAKRAGEAATAEMLGKLGVKSLEEAQAVFKKVQEAEEATKTELQKLQDAVAKANEKVDQANADKAKALEQATERLMKAEVLAQAQAQGFRPEALTDVWLVVDRSKIAEKDGNFTGVKEAVEAVAKSKPFWLAGGGPTGRGTPKPPGNLPPANQQQPPKTPTVRL